jgi:hypothetical protein
MKVQTKMIRPLTQTEIEEAMRMRGYKVPFIIHQPTENELFEAQALIEKGFKVVPKDETSGKVKARVEEW